MLGVTVAEGSEIVAGSVGAAWAVEIEGIRGVVGIGAVLVTW